MIQRRLTPIPDKTAAPMIDKARSTSAQLAFAGAGTGAAKPLMAMAAMLLVRFGSGVSLPAVKLADMPPFAGIVKEAVQTIALPDASGFVVGTAGVQVTAAEAGNPVMLHVAAVAALGPLFAQVKVPLTMLPATALEGKFAVAVISADADTDVL